MLSLLAKTQLHLPVGSIVSSSSLAPLVPECYRSIETEFVSGETAAYSSMYAKVDEMKRLKARETMRAASSLP